MTNCPECNEEFDQMYKLYLHCSKKHPGVEFEFETVLIGRNLKPVQWPTKLKETTNGIQ